MAFTLAQALSVYGKSPPAFMSQLSLLSEPETERVLTGNGPSVWGCDYGSGYFHCFRDGLRRKLRPEQFAELNFATAGQTIVIENAHMQPKRKSLAQVFTIEQLKAIKARSDQQDVKILLWPQSQTPKWRNILQMAEKADDVDAELMSRIASVRGLIGLQRFNPQDDYSPRVLWAFKQIEDMNEILNAARIDYESGKCPAVVEYQKTARHQTQFLCWKLYGVHSRETQMIMRRFYGENSFKQGLSLWSALVNWEGKPRLYEGRMPGVNFVMQEILKMKPNHRRGGVARSNLFYHGFRNEAIKELRLRKGGKVRKMLSEFTEQEHRQWLALRRDYRQAMKLTLKAMQEYLRQEMVV